MTTRAPAGKLVRLDAAAMGRLTRSPQGPVVRFLSVVANRAKIYAREEVGVSTGPLHGTRLVRGREAHLRDTIVVRPALQDSKGPAFLVGSDSPIAQLHHDGTRAHVIRPRNAKALRFAVAGGSSVFSPLGGFIVFTQEVQHPGTQANPFLEKAIERVRHTI